MISEVSNGIVDSSIAAISMTTDRISFIDPSIGIFQTNMGVFIKTPSKRDISSRYFLLGKSKSRSKKNYQHIMKFCLYINVHKPFYNPLISFFRIYQWILVDYWS